MPQVEKKSNVAEKKDEYRAHIKAGALSPDRILKKGVHVEEKKKEEKQSHLLLSNQRTSRLTVPEKGSGEKS